MSRERAQQRKRDAVERAASDMSFVPQSRVNGVYCIRLAPETNWPSQRTCCENHCPCGAYCPLGCVTLCCTVWPLDILCGGACICGVLFFVGCPLPLLPPCCPSCAFVRRSRVNHYTALTNGCGECCSDARLVHPWHMHRGSEDDYDGGSKLIVEDAEASRLSFWCADGECDSGLERRGLGPFCELVRLSKLLRPQRGGGIVPMGSLRIVPDPEELAPGAVEMANRA